MLCSTDELNFKNGQAVVERQDIRGYNWYTLKHDIHSGRPYLGERFPQANKFDQPTLDEPTAPTEQSEALEKGKAREDTDYATDTDSTDDDRPKAKKDSTDDEEDPDTAIIRNSPIGIQPDLRPTIYGFPIMSTITQTAPTITVQLTTTGIPANAANPDPAQRIAMAIN